MSASEVAAAEAATAEVAASASSYAAVVLMEVLTAAEHFFRQPE